MYNSKKSAKEGTIYYNNRI